MIHCAENRLSVYADNNRHLISVSLACLALAGGNIAFLVAIGEGHVPSCFPYIEGCASISAGGRHGTAYWVFKLTIIPSMILLFMYWLLTYHIVVSSNRSRSRIPKAMFTAGIIGAVFGVLYAMFLGSDGDTYKLLRRIGIYFFFLGTFSGQVLEILLTRVQLGIRQERFKPFLLALIIVVLLVCVPFYGFVEGDDVLENVLEWNLTLLIYLFFVDTKRFRNKNGFVL